MIVLFNVLFWWGDPWFIVIWHEILNENCDLIESVCAYGEFASERATKVISCRDAPVVGGNTNILSILPHSERGHFVVRND